MFMLSLLDIVSKGFMFLALSALFVYSFVWTDLDNTMYHE